MTNANTTHQANAQPSIRVGYRFRLRRPVDRFPDFIAQKGIAGIVTLANGGEVWGKMDQHVPGAKEWDNQIHWRTDDEFHADTEAA
jgi:hypothetical protein